jgi:hypothetical protein
MGTVTKTALLKLLWMLVRSGYELPNAVRVMDLAGMLEESSDNEESDAATLLVKGLRKQLKHETGSIHRLAQERDSEAAAKEGERTEKEARIRERDAEAAAKEQERAAKERERAAKERERVEKEARTRERDTEIASKHQAEQIVTRLREEAAKRDS